MSFVAAAIGAAAVIGGAAIQSDSARNAANKQNQAANRANAVANAQWQQQREDNEPWRQAGIGALSQMQDPSFQKTFDGRGFQQDPGYQFRMAEGLKAIQGTAAARGSLNSGRTLKELTRYGQGVASEEYGQAYNRFNTDQTNRFNRLSSLAGLGQTAQGQVGQAGQAYANVYGQNQAAAANASSAASIAQGNAINSAIGTGANMYMANQYARRPNGVNNVG